MSRADVNEEMRRFMAQWTRNRAMAPKCEHRDRTVVGSAVFCNECQRQIAIAGEGHWAVPPTFGVTDSQVTAVLEVLHARRHEPPSEDLARAVLEAAMEAG